ncbi:hypothetical protein WJX77_008790 [Trebouxia sp. C0004]
MRQGFMHNHARVNSYWGYGTYYSSAPRLTLHCQHRVSSADEGVQSGSHVFTSTNGRKQLLAVDVLTGKAKQLAQDTSLCIPRCWKMQA